MLRHYITAHEQTQLNRVCYFRFFNLFLASRGPSYRTYFVGVSNCIIPDAAVHRGLSYLDLNCLPSSF